MKLKNIDNFTIGFLNRLRCLNPGSYDYEIKQEGVSIRRFVVISEFNRVVRLVGYPLRDGQLTIFNENSEKIHTYAENDFCAHGHDLASEMIKKAGPDIVTKLTKENKDER